ncbi:hypothetical protein, partial [Comamonas kerstersii]|uniref:hypothetical protein n=1 Tax=Comamonas kerstersii TaxID=225992 RepID=UPI0026DAE5B4
AMRWKRALLPSSAPSSRLTAHAVCKPAKLHPQQPPSGGFLLFAGAAAKAAGPQKIELLALVFKVFQA